MNNIEIVEQVTLNQQALIATQSFQQGEIISLFESKSIAAEPTYLTVQLADDQHIELFPEYLQYINHSCHPNVFFDVDQFQLIALRFIEEGEELTFFYPSTEWDMIQPFTCLCGESNCLHEIKGAKYLSLNQLGTYRLSSFIQQKLKEHVSRNR